MSYILNYFFISLYLTHFSFYHETPTTQSGNVYFYRKIEESLVEVDSPLPITCEQQFSASNAYTSEGYFIEIKLI